MQVFWDDACLAIGTSKIKPPMIANPIRLFSVSPDKAIYELLIPNPTAFVHLLWWYLLNLNHMSMVTISIYAVAISSFVLFACLHDKVTFFAFSGKIID